MVGVVVDTSGRLLQNAVVALDPLTNVRATLADAQGRFRFDNVSAGSHTLRTAWVGYQPDERTIDVSAAGLEVRIVLVPVPFRLDTLRIVARRTGIFGTTVVRTDFRALGGVDVEVLGTSLRTRTAADGLFSFGQVREGAYVVMGRRNGFATKLIPAAVPRDEAIELAVALDSAPTKEQQIVNNRLQDMRSRMLRRRLGQSAIVPWQELAPRQGHSLDVALRFAPSFLGKALILQDVECVYVDGMPRPGALVKDFTADDILMVEIYAGGGGATAFDMEVFRGAAMECGIGPGERVLMETGKGALRVRNRAKPGVVGFVHIWLKK